MWSIIGTYFAKSIDYFEPIFGLKEVNKLLFTMKERKFGYVYEVSKNFKV